MENTNIIATAAAGTTEAIEAAVKAALDAAVKAAEEEAKAEEEAEAAEEETKAAEKVKVKIKASKEDEKSAWFYTRVRFNILEKQEDGTYVPGSYRSQSPAPIFLSEEDIINRWLPVIQKEAEVKAAVLRALPESKKQRLEELEAQIKDLYIVALKSGRLIRGQSLGLIQESERDEIRAWAEENSEEVQNLRKELSRMYPRRVDSWKRFCESQGLSLSPTESEYLRFWSTNGICSSMSIIASAEAFTCRDAEDAEVNRDGWFDDDEAIRREHEKQELAVGHSINWAQEAFEQKVRRAFSYLGYDANDENVGAHQIYNRLYEAGYGYRVVARTLERIGIDIRKDSGFTFCGADLIGTLLVGSDLEKAQKWLADRDKWREAYEKGVAFGLDYDLMCTDLFMAGQTKITMPTKDSEGNPIVSSAFAAILRLQCKAAIGAGPEKDIYRVSDSRSYDRELAKASERNLTVSKPDINKIYTVIANKLLRTNRQFCMAVSTMKGKTFVGLTGGKLVWANVLQSLADEAAKELETTDLEGLGMTLTQLVAIGNNVDAEFNEAPIADAGVGGEIRYNARNVWSRMIKLAQLRSEANDKLIINKEYDGSDVADEQLNFDSWM